MKIRAYIWILLGVLAIVVNALFGVFPKMYDVVYFRGVFQVIRYIYDYTLGWIPFPMVYVLFLFLVHTIYTFFRFRGIKEEPKLIGKVKRILLPILSLVGAVIFFFYVLWGFNYKQQTLAVQLDFPQVKADTTILFEEATLFGENLNALRNQISKDTNALTFEYLPEQMENEIRERLVKVLASWDMPTGGRVRVRTLYPKGVLLRISTAGVYIPFVFEGHIDAGLHPIQYPFTMAHEMSHGYGIADEGTCNFTGFLACMESNNSMIQYSAMLSLWRYMANNLRRSSPGKYAELIKQLDSNVKRDLIAIMDEMDKYPDILPKVRDLVYDTYLKSHGVKGGMASYSTVVRLLMQWKASPKNAALKNKIYDKGMSN